MVGDMALSFSEGANELSHFSVFSVSCYMLLVMSVSIWILGRLVGMKVLHIWNWTPVIMTFYFLVLSSFPFPFE